MRVDILTRRSLQRSSSSSFSCSVTRNLMSLVFLGVPLCWGLCLVERVLVLVIVPPCCLTSSSLELRSEEHTSELQSRFDLVCRLLLEKKNKKSQYSRID